MAVRNERLREQVRTWFAPELARARPGAAPIVDVLLTNASILHLQELLDADAVVPELTEAVIRVLAPRSPRSERALRSPRPRCRSHRPRRSGWRRGATSCSSSQRVRQPPDAQLLGAGHRLGRCAVRGGLVRVFTSQNTTSAAVDQHQVELTVAAAPVAGRRTV